jgi:hypothetical protein
MRFLLLVVLVTAACAGQPAPAAIVTPTAPHSGSPASAERSASPSSPSNAIALACRLPITWDVNTGQGFVRKAGFLTFPEQIVSEDPSAPSGSSFYDRAFGRWLPVYREAVSYDGTRYAYATGSAFQRTNGSLHVVDLRTGADRTIFSGDFVYRVIEFAPEGIYLTAQAPEGRSRGLWLQNPSGGAARQISSSVIDPWFSGGAAWGEDFDTADPSPAPGGLEGPMNRLVRIDLQTGATTAWFSWFGADVYLDGVDYQGNPFVGVGRSQGPNATDNLEELWLITSPGAGQRLFAGPASQSWPFRLAAIDGHGVWFNGGSYQTSPRTIWLYSGGSIRIVAIVNLNDITIAGGCINT